MAKDRRVQLPNVAMWVLVLSLLLFFVVSMFSPLAAFAEPSNTDTSAEIIKSSAVWPVLWWCFSWPILFARRRDPSHVFGDLAALWRVFWTLGCVLLIIHIAVAFHLGHGWSHEAAWKHTKQAGGYGDGIYVNYAFVLIWAADVVWAWVAFRSYLSRPRWLRWAIFLFQSFIVLNATVVFAAALNTRLLFLFLFLSSSVCLWQVWWTIRQHDKRRNQSTSGAGASPSAK